MHNAIQFILFSSGRITMTIQFETRDIIDNIDYDIISCVMQGSRGCAGYILV